MDSSTVRDSRKNVTRDRARPPRARRRPRALNSRARVVVVMSARAIPRAGAFVVVLSPAKAMNERPLSAKQRAIVEALRTTPAFADRASAIAADAAKTLSAAKIKSLMSVSDAIASLNAKRYAEFEEAPTKEAALCFDGPAFKHLDADSLDGDGARYLQHHLRVLSGMYGVLRAYDAIAPYRLEMGTRWAPAASKAKDLYEFWGADIANALADDVEALAKVTKTKPFVVNCASQEYWKAVKVEALAKRGVDVYTMTFPGPAVHAKQARGAMVRHIVDARVACPEDLKTFVGTDGCWTFDAGASSEFNFVFRRGVAKPKREAPSSSKTTAKKAKSEK